MSQRKKKVIKKTWFKKCVFWYKKSDKKKGFKIKEN